MALNWRHGFGGRKRSPQEAVANDVARVHHRTASIARVANVKMESVGGFGGLYLCAYGPYFVAMNASGEPTACDLGEHYAKGTIDLVSGREVTEPHLEVPAHSTAIRLRPLARP